MTNDKDSAVLLPCPFCGSDPTLEERGDGDLFVVLCQTQSSCYGSGLATFGMRSKREEAIAAWNTRQPQTDALKIARERITEWCDAVAVEWGQGSQTHNVARDGRDTALAALRQPQTDALAHQLLQECLVKLRDVQGTQAPKQYACNLIKRIERVLQEQSK